MYKKEFKAHAHILLSSIAGLLLGGALLFSIIEGWSFLDALYFATMTATTVGYGDLIPTHAASKLLTIVYALAIIPYVLYAFAIVAKFNIEAVYHKVNKLERKEKAHEEGLKEQETLNIKQQKELEEQKRKIEKTTEELTAVETVVEDVIDEVTKDEKAKK